MNFRNTDDNLDTNFSTNIFKKNSGRASTEIPRGTLVQISDDLLDKCWDEFRVEFLEEHLQKSREKLQNKSQQNLLAIPNISAKHIVDNYNRNLGKTS